MDLFFKSTLLLYAASSNRMQDTGFHRPLYDFFAIKICVYMTCIPYYAISYNSIVSGKGEGWYLSKRLNTLHLFALDVQWLSFDDACGS